jgi:hypothetical protein
MIENDATQERCRGVASGVETPADDHRVALQRSIPPVEFHPAIANPSSRPQRAAYSPLSSRPQRAADWRLSSRPQPAADSRLSSRPQRACERSGGISSVHAPWFEITQLRSQALPTRDDKGKTGASQRDAMTVDMDHSPRRTVATCPDPYVLFIGRPYTSPIHGATDWQLSAVPPCCALGVPL